MWAWSVNRSNISNLSLNPSVVVRDLKGRTISPGSKCRGKRPRSAEIHYNFGIALWQMGQASRSIPELRLAAELNPYDGLAHCALGKALLSGGEVREGDSELKRARELGSCPSPNGVQQR